MSLRLVDRDRNIHVLQYLSTSTIIARVRCLLSLLLWYDFLYRICTLFLDIAWLKTNLWKEHVLSSKRLQDENSHDQDKINKKTHSKRKKSHQLIRFNSSLKTSSYASSCYSKNLFNITCYICNWKSHYFTDCKDEKIKNKSKESDVNQVFIDLMSHMSRFKISRKDKLSINASNHRGKNKKFSS